MQNKEFEDVSLKLKDVASLYTITNVLAFLKGTSHCGNVFPSLNDRCVVLVLPCG